MDTEGKGWALMMLGESLTEIDHQRPSGNYLQAFSSVEDVRVDFSTSSYSLRILRLKHIIGRTPGTLEPRTGHAGQRPEGERRQFVTFGLRHSRHVFVSRLVGLLFEKGEL
jgi:hypothetical protein